MPPPVKQPVRFARPKRRAEIWSRQAILACALAALATGFILAGATQCLRTAPQQQAEIESDAELYTGTIQLAPSRTNICRRMTFDNRSGQMQEHGSVLCGGPVAVAAAEAQAERSRVRSLDLVREGFRNR
jgi:hypothetical protein